MPDETLYDVNVMQTMFYEGQIIPKILQIKVLS